MTKDDTKKLLMYLKAVYPSMQVTQFALDVWSDVLEKHGIEPMQEAAKAYITEAHDWPPTPGHLIEKITKKIPAITATASEALAGEGDADLYRAAKILADRATASVDGQFDSPEELDKANRIREATWRRNFKDAYEKLQDGTKENIRLGLSAPEAVAIALGHTTEPRRIGSGDFTRIGAPELKKVRI